MKENSVKSLLDSPQIERNVLIFSNNRLLIDLCGAYDKNLAELEQKLSIQILRRGNRLALHGQSEAIDDAKAILTELYQRLEGGCDFEPGDLDRAVRGFGCNRVANEKFPQIKTRKKTIVPRTPGQK